MPSGTDRTAAAVTVTIARDPALVRTVRLVAASVARRAGRDEEFVEEVRLAAGAPPLLIAGPCVVESYDLQARTAETLKAIHGEGAQAATEGSRQAKALGIRPDALLDTVDLFRSMGKHVLGAGKDEAEARKPAIVAVAITWLAALRTPAKAKGSAHGSSARISTCQRVKSTRSTFCACPVLISSAQARFSGASSWLPGNR